MAKREQKPTPQEPGGVAVLVLIFAVLILLAGMVRLVTGLISSSEVPRETKPVQTEAVTEPVQTEPTEEKQSFWDKLFGGKKEEEETTPGTSAPEAAPTPVSTAAIGSMGDLLMHIQLFSPEHNSIAANADGSYDFSSIFEYLGDTVSGYDYAVANLETTFGGNGNPYQGNPAFNCPDELARELANTGYDMMLTANNHCADTLLAGIKRTISTVRGEYMVTLGTRATEEEKRYTITDINGIKVGMTCYTYTMKMVDGVPSLNGGLPLENKNLVNYFTYDDLPGFYSEIGTVYSDMLAAGAEATMLYIHWGDEYQLTENSQQNAIAQKMCDLGFDVIVGGHPHVVQPMELLTSNADPEHKTVCIYSLGNSVSNQRLGKLNSIKTAHTEDGVLFGVTFQKYSDGSVFLADVDVLPLWVNMHESTGKLEYNILPLDKTREDTWQDDFGLTPDTLKAAKDSYKRSMDIVGAGLSDCRSWISQQRQTP